MKLLNYTPHRNLAFVGHDGLRTPLPQVGNARAQQFAKPGPSLDAFGGVPTQRVSYGDITGLPEPASGIALVVSMLIVQLCPDRTDLYFPDDLLRDDDGTIVGFRRLGQLATQ